MTERFELLEQIGKGGMGTVWKARESETGDIVALKLLHEMYVDDADYVARFEREVDIARKIDSPHVVKVLGYGKRGGVPYVAMEYVDGPSLKDLIRDKGAQGWEDWGQAKRIALQLTEALRAAHAVGVIHRDVKPSNVLIDPQGNVKLADFGIARAADLTRMTGGYTMMGTPAYMSPEGDSSVQSDLYALGCVLYEMLAGAPPFAGDTQQQVLLKHIRELPDLTRLPEEARPVAGWLLEKEPKDRPPSAAALMAVLDGSTKGMLPRPVGVGQAERGRLRKRAALAGVFGLPVMILAGIGGFVAATGGDDGTAPDEKRAGEVDATGTSSVGVPSPTPTSYSPPATRTPTATSTTEPTFTPTPTPTATANPSPTSTAAPDQLISAPTGPGAVSVHAPLEAILAKATILSWTAPPSNVTGYNVYFRWISGCGTSSIMQVQATKLSADVTAWNFYDWFSRSGYGSYCFTKFGVAAVNEGGESPITWGPEFTFK